MYVVRLYMSMELISDNDPTKSFKLVLISDNDPTNHYKKVATVDHLRKRGMTSTNILDTCTVCGKENKTINHLSLHCEVTV